MSYCDCGARATEVLRFGDLRSEPVCVACAGLARGRGSGLDGQGPDGVAERLATVVRLTRLGESAEEIAIEIERSARQVTRLRSLAAARGLLERGPACVVAYPKMKECELCGEVYSPEGGAAERMRRRYCSIRCYQRHRRSGGRR